MDRVSVLEAHALYRFYHAGDDEVVALGGVSLRVGAGEFVAVTGPSGSGKSTLLSCLAGLDTPDGGWVEVGGERITRRPEQQRARVRANRIGMLMQAGNFFDHLTVRSNLELVATIGRPLPATRAIAQLETVGLGHRADAMPAQLSGGELARAGLAMASMHDPAILLADEPTAEIDQENEQVILHLLRERSAAGHSTLVATHSERVVAAADRVIHLVDGSCRDA